MRVSGHDLLSRDMTVDLPRDGLVMSGSMPPIVDATTYTLNCCPSTRECLHSLRCTGKSGRSSWWPRCCAVSLILLHADIVISSRGPFPRVTETVFGDRGGGTLTFTLLSRLRKGIPGGPLVFFLLEVVGSGGWGAKPAGDQLLERARRSGQWIPTASCCRVNSARYADNKNR